MTFNIQRKALTIYSHINFESLLHSAHRHPLESNLPLHLRFVQVATSHQQKKVANQCTNRKCYVWTTGRSLSTLARQVIDLLVARRLRFTLCADLLACPLIRYALFTQTLRQSWPSLSSLSKRAVSLSPSLNSQFVLINTIMCEWLGQSFNHLLYPSMMR